MFGANDTAAILDALQHQIDAWAIDDLVDEDDFCTLKNAESAILDATMQAQEFEPLAVLDSDELAKVERAVSDEIERWEDEGLGDDDYPHLREIQKRLRQLMGVYIKIAKEVAE